MQKNTNSTLNQSILKFINKPFSRIEVAPADVRCEFLKQLPKKY